MILRLFLKSFLTLIFVSLAGLGFAQAASHEGNFVRWNWMKSDCQNCPIIFEIKNHELQTKKVRAFIDALESSKFEIVKLYKSDPQEYNLLAQMAVGILGRESNFYKSWRYFAKEELQWSVSILKIIKTVVTEENDKPSLNSRGPTQIKIVPARIAKYYGITADDLSKPENAARATMGYLIEALKELKNRALKNNLTFITEETFADYLPYIYFGASYRLTNGTATPDRNLYIQSMRIHMAQVQIYEFHSLK